MPEESIDRTPPVSDEAPVVRHLKEQITIAKGWAQFLTEYTVRGPGPGDARVTDGLARIDAATTRMTALLEQPMQVAHLDRLD
ncbi:MAG TPA: hypothetical protein VF221_17060 [Chloroflexota bacterium]